MFKFNFDKSGKGVSEHGLKRPKVLMFFVLLWRKLWVVCKTNLFYLFSSIPIFFVMFFIMVFFSSQIIHNDLQGIQGLIWDVVLRIQFSFLFLVFYGYGPMTVGITYILNNYANEKHVFFLSDWWYYLKANFKQSLIIWILDVASLYILATAIVFYSNLGNWFLLIAGFLLCFAMIYIVMHFYIYLLLINFKNSIKDILKNALILTMQKAPRNILLLLIIVIIHIGFPYFSIVLEWGPSSLFVFILAEILVLPALTNFMIDFFIYPQIKIHISDKDRF